MNVAAWPLFVAVFLGVCFWGWIFGTAWGNFWWKMTAAAVVLSGFSLWINRAVLPRDLCVSLRHAGFGILSAVLLYAVFWVGGELLRRVIPVSGNMIAAVYAVRTALPEWSICLLLVFIIAPAEEIFWRGLVQKRLAALTNPHFGLIVGALIYALVHLWAKNGVLLPAAFVCGIIWGWHYHRSGSLAGPIISHALWDATVFIFIPLA
jgi:membrane protease YdiL (CAAX protease family)